MKNFIAGLVIIQAAKPITETNYHGRAEHDIFFAGSSKWDLSKEDKQILEDLGWELDEGADGYSAMF